MEPFLVMLFAGFAGGVVRGIVGYIKYQFQFKSAKFNPPYFFGMMVLSGLVGVFTVSVIQQSGIPVLGGVFTPAIAALAGYAGGDFIENTYKIVLGKTSIYS